MNRQSATVWAMHAGLFLWLLIALVPPVLLLAAALNRTAIFRAPLGLLLLRDFTLENVTTALAQGDFFLFLQNSIIIAFSAVTLTIVICVPTAYGLTKIGPRPREVLSFAVLAMRFLPFVVLVPPPDSGTPICVYAASGSVSTWSRRNRAGER